MTISCKVAAKAGDFAGISCCNIKTPASCNFFSLLTHDRDGRWVDGSCICSSELQSIWGFCRGHFFTFCHQVPIRWIPLYISSSAMICCATIMELQSISRLRLLRWSYPCACLALFALMTTMMILIQILPKLESIVKSHHPDRP